MSTHAIPFKISNSQHDSFRVQVDKGRHFYEHLHYHPEFQITAIKKGRGYLLHGNDLIQFMPGDVFILGPNVPHLMKNLEQGIAHESACVQSVSLFFDRNVFGSSFFNLPELNRIDTMLNHCERGIFLSGNSRRLVYRQMLKMVWVREEELIISFLKILSTIRKAEKSFINTHANKRFLEWRDEKRLNKILDHAKNNLDTNIKIEEMAQIANLSKSQFSRYFKLHTGKTFIEFLNEMRIESSCALLLDEGSTIEGICYEVGFSNLSHFNRQFKRIKGMTPSQYRSLRRKGIRSEAAQGSAVPV